MRSRSPFCIALSILAVVVCAGAQPPLKEGLWSSHTVTTNQPGNKKTEGARSICRSHAYDEHVREIAKKAEEKCKTISENSSGQKITTVSECTIGSSVLRTTGTATMSGDIAAHSETRTTYAPPMYGLTETTMVMDQKYVGACPAGVGPGDTIEAGGKVIHHSKM
jgi:hypothetical protein